MDKNCETCKFIKNDKNCNNCVNYSKWESDHETYHCPDCNQNWNVIYKAWSYRLLPATRGNKVCPNCYQIKKMKTITEGLN